MHKIEDANRFKSPVQEFLSSVLGNTNSHHLPWEKKGFFCFVAHIKDVMQNEWTDIILRPQDTKSWWKKILFLLIHLSNNRPTLVLIIQLSQKEERAITAQQNILWSIMWTIQRQRERSYAPTREDQKKIDRQKSDLANRAIALVKKGGR